MIILVVIVVSAHGAAILIIVVIVLIALVVGVPVLTCAGNVAFAVVLPFIVVPFVLLLLVMLLVLIIPVAVGILAFCSGASRPFCVVVAVVISLVIVAHVVVLLFGVSFQVPSLIVKCLLMLQRLVVGLLVVVLVTSCVAYISWDLLDLRNRFLL